MRRNDTTPSPKKYEPKIHVVIVDENSPVKCYWSPPDNTAVMLDQDGNKKVADDLAEEDGFIVALWACGANKWWKWSSEVPLLEFMESLGEEEPVPKPKKSRAVSKRPVLKRPMHACMKRPAGKVTKVKWSGFSESLNIPKKKKKWISLHKLSSNLRSRTSRRMRLKISYGPECITVWKLKCRRLALIRN